MLRRRVPLRWALQKKGWVVFSLKECGLSWHLLTGKLPDSYAPCYRTCSRRRCDQTTNTAEVPFHRWHTLQLMPDGQGLALAPIKCMQAAACQSHAPGNNFKAVQTRGLAFLVSRPMAMGEALITPTPFCCRYGSRPCRLVSTRVLWQ